MRLCSLHSRLRALLVGAVVIQHLETGRVCLHQFFGARELAVCSVELGFMLGNDCCCCGALCLALCDHAFRGIYSNDGALQFRLGLAALRLQLLDVHLGQNLPLFDEVAFVDEDIFQSAGRLRGDVDFHGFNATVATGDAGGEIVGSHALPGEICATGYNNGGGGEEPRSGSGVHCTHLFVILASWLSCCRLLLGALNAYGAQACRHAKHLRRLLFFASFWGRSGLCLRPPPM